MQLREDERTRRQRAQAVEDEAQRALMFKQAMIDEVNHRAKNTLQAASSLLSLQARSAASAEVRNALLDTWLGRFGLGRAYLAAGQFPQADSEFERCQKRRGEALQLVLNDEPTYAFLPPLYYYQGLVREGLKSEGSVDSYREYLNFRGTSTEDPLVKDIQKRIGG